MSRNEIRDLRDTIIPKSDQLNAEQLLGGPITITVTDVRRGSSQEQPLTIHYEGEGGRPYKPCKTMRKVLVFAWGNDGTEWIGRSMTLYNRPDVKFGGEEVGGIRISHLSHIPKDMAVSLTATRGRKEQTRIAQLKEINSVSVSSALLEAAARGGMKDLKAAWASIPDEHKRSINGTKGCPDELKQIAMKADTNKPTDALPTTDDAPAIDPQELNDRLLGAFDIDALHDAAADISLIADPEAKAALTKLYAERGAELSE